MKVYNHLSEFKHVNNAVVTIGTFDGLHLGHQKIIERVKESAAEINGESVLLSFFPHPRMVLQPENNALRLINSLDEKIALLKEAGIDHIIIHPFDKAFSQLTSEEYISEILVGGLNVKRLIIGYDHHFGKDRSGSFKQLQQFSKDGGFELEEISARDIDDIHISSTKIRTALAEGNVRMANEFLGYNFFMRGLVVKGDQRGRALNFPTANLYIEEKYKLIPGNGVYAVQVKIQDESHQGMLNIGNRPTFPGRDFSVEVHILNFDRDIYNETIEVDFIDRIRDEKKFDDATDLAHQLKRDKETVKSLLI